MTPNPNPLQPEGRGGAILTVANKETDKALAPISPNGKALFTLSPSAAAILTAIAALAGCVPMVCAAIPTAPAWITPVAVAVASILGALGISSGGARQKPPEA